MRRRYQAADARRAERIADAFEGEDPPAETRPAAVLVMHTMDPQGPRDLLRALSVCGWQAGPGAFPCGNRAVWQAELVDGPLRARVGLCDRHQAPVRTVPTLARLWRVPALERQEMPA